MTLEAPFPAYPKFQGGAAAKVIYRFALVIERETI